MTSLSRAMLIASSLGQRNDEHFETGTPARMEYAVRVWRSRITLSMPALCNLAERRPDDRALGWSGGSSLHCGYLPLLWLIWCAGAGVLDLLSLEVAIVACEALQKAITTISGSFISLFGALLAILLEGLMI